MGTENSERGRCPRCREDRALVTKARRQVRHALPTLKSPLEVVQTYACPECDCEVKSTVWMLPTDGARPRPGPIDDATGGVERRSATLMRFDGQSGMMMHYPAVIRPGEDVLFPAHEGAFGGGHAIDRYGDPDLMAEFSAEYLKTYRAIVPTGSLPRRVSEMMPALHLLVNATELALKADLIRSERNSGGHSLEALYGRLHAAHRHDVERRFAESEPNANLRTLGCAIPGVDSVLRAYGTGLSWSPTYEETRYYAEPTTRIRAEDAKGGNVVKQTPYPIFLPYAVTAMLASYAYFSGAERLKRRGAAIAYRSRDPGNDNHGDWGLMPLSLGLVVIQVSQQVATDESGMERADFRRFVEEHPPWYRTEWMYGGNRLLFYRVGGERPVDGPIELDGLACRVWHTGRLGVHARDLYRLADVIEGEEDAQVFEWRVST